VFVGITEVVVIKEAVDADISNTPFLSRILLLPSIYVFLWTRPPIRKAGPEIILAFLYIFFVFIAPCMNQVQFNLHKLDPYA